MPFRSASLSLILAAAVSPLAAQEPVPAPAVPVEPPPVAVPVEEAPAPAAIPVEEVPSVVAPGGNVPQPVAAQRAVSRSGMFRVAGGESAQRSSVALLLEQTKDQFEGLLKSEGQEKVVQARDAIRLTPKGQQDDFKVPVDVILTGKPGDPPPPRSVAYELAVAPEAFFLRIHIHLARGIDNELLERAALTVLLYERSLRDLTPQGYDEVLVVRPWLVEGLVETIKWRTNRADRRIYEGVFRQGGGFTLDEIFELPEQNYVRLDAASRLSYRALSGSLVMALLDQPDGRDAFHSFCGEAARFSGEMPVLLRKHFPQLNLSGNSLSKWWALKLAQMIQPQLTEVLSVVETERSLAEVLQFHMRDADGNAANQGIGAWKAIIALKEPDRAEAVRPAEDGLTRLSFRCFPSYRPLLIEYQQLLRDIVAGKDNEKMDMHIEELGEQRRIRMERAIAARDYLDFIEISQARELSGEFDDYMRLKQELELRPRPQRHDRITQALDTLEKAYGPRRKR